MEEEKNIVYKNRVKDILEWVYCIIIAIVLAVLIKYYLGTPTVVKQSSMYPTLVEQDRLLLGRVNRIGKKKKVEEIFKRGDIITFEAPSDSSYTNIDLENPVAKYDNEPNGWWNKFVYYVLEFNKISYIKRVIAFPGEHVEIKDDKVYIDGNPLEEKYLDSSVKTTVSEQYYNDFIVPENCVFAMGDNRKASEDCRKFGCIPLERIEGKVLFRFFPFNKIGSIDE